MALEPKQARLLCMLCLTCVFFVVEVVVSRVTGSLAMLSDSFHMLSDVIALLVALLAVRLADQTAATSLNTFGWIRAEVMGALVNAVFLTALCFTILLEAVERYTEPHEIEKPTVVVWVGVAGLVVNVLGLLLFHGYAGHGHSHSTSNRRYEKSETSSGEAYDLLVKSQRPGRGDHAVQVEADIVSKHNLEIPVNGNISPEKLEHDLDSSSQLNMRGVFLHVLGDAAGSVIVVINALIFTFVWRTCDNQEICINPCLSSYCSDHWPVNNTHLVHSNGTSAVAVAGPCWVLYLDPTLCVILVAILLYTTFPLLKESTLILLQSVPKQIDMQRLDKKLRSLEGVLAVHELHIWQLAGSRIIATAHVKCHDPASYMDTAKRIKNLFHEEGIHATTVQPEFSDDKELCVSECELPCYNQCTLKLCCDMSWKSRSESVLGCTYVSSSENTPQRSTASCNIQQNSEVFLQTEVESTV
ncbi:proton-coupled zinc antiporter SLC30A1 [Ictalurus punctatus]|uniref:Proton-coupled zinc antiporter SLC30A1 n=1 Tax=Ictalurus punctatus TaxID=7998 RepID=A0A2D0RLS9_ICTPU|nr:proton-coupled zinc antiporter SLC30A1 [Ictalurus punctatus]